MTKKESVKKLDYDEHKALYDVSQETIRSLEEALETGQTTQVHALLKGLHVADIATIIEHLSPSLRHHCVDLLKPHINLEILTHLNETVREEVVNLIGTKEIAKAIIELESDDVVALIEDLDKKQQKEILASLPAKKRAIVENSLTYPQDSAARLMQQETVSIPKTWTVEETLSYLTKEKTLPEKFYDLFVVDQKRTVIGGIPLSLLLRQPSSIKMEELMHTDIKPIPALMDQEEVALLFRKYGLVSAPVVDEKGCLLGMITVDDVVDVIEEEAEEDIMLLSRITESDFYDPLLTTSYSRIRWLIITLLSTLLAATVISQFQHTIEKMVALAVLMPIVAAMSGNAGMQVVTVTVRALATRELGSTNMSRAIWKEILVGILNGIVFGSLVGSISAFWFSDKALGIVLSGAVALNMVCAAIGGVTLPILIDKMRMDPAISAGPFLTTTTDLLSFATFLGLAQIFLF